MHNESMIVAAVLGVIGLILISQKNSGARAVGVVVAALAGLMVVAGVTG